MQSDIIPTFYLPGRSHMRGTDASGTSSDYAEEKLMNCVCATMTIRGVSEDKLAETTGHSQGCMV